MKIIIFLILIYACSCDQIKEDDRINIGKPYIEFLTSRKNPINELSEDFSFFKQGFFQKYNINDEALLVRVTNYSSSDTFYLHLHVQRYGNDHLFVKINEKGDIQFIGNDGLHEGVNTFELLPKKSENFITNLNFFQGNQINAIECNFPFSRDDKIDSHTTEYVKVLVRISDGEIIETLYVK